MRRTITIAFVLSMILASCNIDVDIGDPADNVAGSGNRTTEGRTVGDFERITLAGEGTVTVVAGPTSISITTDDNLFQHIETSVSGGELRIETEDGIDIDPTDSVDYLVSTPTLTGVSLSGAGGFKIDSWDVATFTISLAGAGDIDMEVLTAGSLVVTIAGVGDVMVIGSADSLDVTISGAGNFNGAELQAADVAATTSGVGSATVWATATLDATVSGVGSIDYYGEPSVAESVTGLGSINSKGAK